MNNKLKFRQPIKDKKGNFIEWFYWGYWAGAWNEAAIHMNGRDSRRESQQYMGLFTKQGQEICEGDILVLSKSEELFNRGFENSSAGKFMIEHAIDQMVIVLGVSEYLSPFYKIYFKQQSVFVTELDIYHKGIIPGDVKEYEKKELLERYYQFETDIQFLRYLSDKIEVAGNVFENPELLNHE